MTGLLLRFSFSGGECQGCCRQARVIERATRVIFSVRPQQASCTYREIGKTDALSQCFHIIDIVYVHPLCQMSLTPLAYSVLQRDSIYEKNICINENSVNYDINLDQN